MGTHISRVKSVDLDAWTDEQLASVLKWGNTRANKYWEAKLAPGHVPSEAKIENFIRTKYESKRWVMDGPIPDPSTLDVEGDDDVPLNLVKEKQTLERASSQRVSSSQAAAPRQVRREPQPDLFGDDDIPAAPRQNTSAPPAAKIPPKAEAAPPKSTKPADSLLGLDFFGTEAPVQRPASAAPAPGAQSRPDLKQSILSLYASAPRPQQPQQQQQSFHSQSGSFGGLQSASPPPQTQNTSFGGLDDAFSSLSFTSTSPPISNQSNKTSAFSNLGSYVSPKATTTQLSSPPLSGGGFFDSKPAQKPATQPQPSQPSAFGFTSTPAASSSISGNTSSGLADLFDFSSTPQSPPPPKQNIGSPTTQSTSVFNLSTPASPPKPTTQPAPTSNAWASAASDPWGSGNAWSTPDPPSSSMNQASLPAQNNRSNSFGWGSGSLANQSIVPGGSGGFTPSASAGPPKVSADEDFGSWSSAPSSKPAVPAKPSGGLGGNDDLFSNVWE